MRTSSTAGVVKAQRGGLQALLAASRRSGGNNANRGNGSADGGGGGGRDGVGDAVDGNDGDRGGARGAAEAARGQENRPPAAAKAAAKSSSSSSAAAAGARGENPGRRRPRSRNAIAAKPAARANYRRFNAAHMTGIHNLDHLAAIAAQALQDGEDHFGGTLHHVRHKSRRAKRRSELRQQQFAWAEEQRAMRAEAAALEKDIQDALGRVAQLGITGPLDEHTMVRTRFEDQLRVAAAEQLTALRGLVREVTSASSANADAVANPDADTQHLETAAVLFDVMDAQAMVFSALTHEAAECEREAKAARAAVFESLRAAEANEDAARRGEGGKATDDRDVLVAKSVGRDEKRSGARNAPTTRRDVWDQLMREVERVNAEEQKGAAAASAADDSGTSAEAVTATVLMGVSDALVHEVYEHACAQLGEHLARRSALRRKQSAAAADAAAANVAAAAATTAAAAADAANDGSDENNGDSSSASPVHHQLVAGWPVDEHRLFAKAWRECVDRGKGHGAFRKRVALLLPHLSRDAVSAHTAWFERHRYVSRQLREETTRWERTWADNIRSEARRRFAAQVAAEREMETRRRALARTMATGAALHQELSVMRAEYERRQAAMQAKQDAMDREAAALAHQAAAAEQRRRDAEKVRVEGFQEARASAAQQAREARIRAEARAAAQSRAEAPQREARIEHRRGVLAARERQRLAELQEREAARETRNAALERLKRECAYFEKIQDIAANQDPAHVLQVTRAYDNAVRELEAIRAAGGFQGEHERGQNPLNGFTSRKVVGDIRFKLVEQLRAAGLQATPYAQAMIINMSRQLRPQPVLQVSASAPWGPRLQP